MEDIVESVRQVTDVMAEIMAVSQKQSTDIEQVNQAIGQMDQVTQQNPALVEEAAAAARSLQEQAGNLAKEVCVFKLDGVPYRGALHNRLHQRVTPVLASALVGSQFELRRAIGTVATPATQTTATALGGNWE